MRDLLELKDIALLYELWTFFRLVHEISAVLGRPPVRSRRLTSGPFQTAFAAGGTFEWDPGVRLEYNQRFSRSRNRQRHSYSVPLIPHIALRVPDGPNVGLHLFDAKFRVRALTDVGIAAARSVWILYPGGEFRFFGVRGGGGRFRWGVGRGVRGVVGRGTGAGNDGSLRATLGRVLAV